MTSVFLVEIVIPKSLQAWEKSSMLPCVRIERAIVSEEEIPGYDFVHFGLS